jgi:predicted SAM-dependent methyltransferase
MALLPRLIETNRKLNDRFFPRNKPRHVDRFREQVLALSENGRVLLHLGSGPKDLGATCGVDRPRLINLDIGLEELRKNPGSLRVCANAEALPLPSDSVDAVCAEHVFEHIARPQRVLGECFRVLKQGGYLVVSGPNGQSYIALAARLSSLRFHDKVRRLNRNGDRDGGDGYPTFYRFSTPRAMQRLARKAGFEVVAMERFVGEPCYTVFLPVAHALFIAYHLLLEKLPPWFGFHITSVATFCKPRVGVREST